MQGGTGLITNGGGPFAFTTVWWSPDDPDWGNPLRARVLETTLAATSVFAEDDRGLWRRRSLCPTIEVTGSRMVNDSSSKTVNVRRGRSIFGLLKRPHFLPVFPSFSPDSHLVGWFCKLRPRCLPQVRCGGSRRIGGREWADGPAGEALALRRLDRGRTRSDRGGSWKSDSRSGTWNSRESAPVSRRIHLRAVRKRSAESARRLSCPDAAGLRGGDATTPTALGLSSTSRVLYLHGGAAGRGSRNFELSAQRNGPTGGGRTWRSTSFQELAIRSTNEPQSGRGLLDPQAIHRARDLVASARLSQVARAMLP